MTPVQSILTHKIVAIIRLKNYERALDVARALVAGGIRVMEFTLTGRGALEAIVASREAFGDQVCVGVGSVLKPADAQAAIDSGAHFVVTPAVRPAVIATCVNRNTPTLCGGFTPTELLTAHEAGAELIKLFPAQLGGPRYLKDVLAPLPFLKLVPTGGVSADNAPEYLAAGAVAVGLGSTLVSDEWVASGSWSEIESRARACRQAVG